MNIALLLLVCCTASESNGVPAEGADRPALPHPKDVTLAEAKLALRDMLEVLTSPQGHKVVETAMQMLVESPKPKSMQEGQKIRMIAVGTVLTELLRPITSQHGFEGGFLQALESIKKAAATAENDQEIAKGLQPIRELMTGHTEIQHAKLMTGRITELDEIVEGICDMRKAEMKKVMAKLNTTIRNEGEKGSTFKPMRLTQPLSGYYLHVVEKLTQYGPTFIEQEGPW
jgi:hypothetical protein